MNLFEMKVRKLRIFGLLAATATLLLFLCGGASPASGQLRTQDAASLRMDAPERVEVGRPVKVSLVVKGASEVGGYETNLLFDREAAKFAALSQETGPLGQAGRDVGSLGAAHTFRGVSIGAFSCPVRDCVHPGRGPETRQGPDHNVRLATATVTPTRPGRLEVALDQTKVVDVAGKPIDVGDADLTAVVEVAASEDGSFHPAPGGVPWTLRTTVPSQPEAMDLTGDKRVVHADGMEAALSWTLLREKGRACGNLGQNAPSDINGDGCVDVSDLQTIVANYDTDLSNPGGLASLPLQGILGIVRDSMSSVVSWATPRPALAQETSAFVVGSEADGADARLGDGSCATVGGVCTLRAAIEESNLHQGPDRITFNIPGTGVRTIQIGSPLPTINDASGTTTIDGYTQPGSSPNTAASASDAKIMVQITAPTDHTRDAMVITSPNNLVRGLAFFNLRRSIWLYGDGADNNTVSGTFVGTDAAGEHFASTAVFPADGIQLQNGAAGNTIGGASVADRNVVSGNAYRGVVTLGEFSDNNRIVNNIVGLGPAGNKRLPNVKHGIDINGGSSGNQIGGVQENERNVVSGNGEEGVEISHEPTTTENVVAGNFIGTDVGGKTAPIYTRNGGWGVHLEDRVSNNTVLANVIGNSTLKGGIRIGNLVTGTVVQDNRIGISLDGTRIPNSASGVQVDTDSSGSRIGPGNVIANNNLDGVRITAANSDRNTVTRNSIYNNGRLGIDLEPIGAANPNDPGDADEGANGQLNHPTLESATPQVVSGTACAGCTVEIFVADAGAGTAGEGRTFLAAAPVDANGKFAATVSGTAEGIHVTATATDQVGNTSEFSPNRMVSNDAVAPSVPANPTATSSRSSVGLDWDDNTEADLSGYSVYRSSTTGGPYKKVASPPSTTSSYTDTTVVRGNTYYYAVTAFDSGGNESGFSKEVRAHVPSGALSFDGVDDRVSIPSSTLLNSTGTNQRTYELKIKTGANVNAGQIVYEEGGGKGNGFSVEISDGNLYFNAWALGGTGTWDTVSAGAPIAPNATYHVSGVYQQSVGEVRLYLDGTLRATSTGAGTMKSHGESGVLGGVEGSTRDHARSNVSSGSHFGGVIDEVRVWRQALTQTQIQNGMGGDLSGAESGLILLYEAEEGSGTVLGDSSPNKLDGAINGAAWTTTTG